MQHAPSAPTARLRRFRSLGHRAPLLWVVLPLMAGLSLAHAGLTLPKLWASAGVLGFGGIVLGGLWRKMPRPLNAFCGCAALIVLGVVYYGIKRPFPVDWDWLPPREAELSLRVTRTFAQAREGQISGLARIEATAPHLSDLLGQRVYFSLRLPHDTGAAPVLRSSVIDALGVIRALPRNPSPEEFEHYLDNAGVNFRFAQGQVLQTRRPASGYRQFCARMATRFSEILGLGIEAKQPLRTSILRAMLLGQKSQLNAEQNALFRTSGTMHVFAISGLHIGVIAGVLHWGLSFFRLPDKLRLIVELSALWLYVDITGGAPSAVRAFIMVALFLVAIALRQPINPLATLTNAALLVLCLDPLQIFSASFQMSYGIVAALLLLGLPLAETWQNGWQPYALLPKATWTWPQRALDQIRRWLLTALGLGVAATLVSTVTGVQFFQLFTPGSLLINLWAIFWASWAIMAGFASLLAGLIGGAIGIDLLATLANHVALALLWLTETGIRLFMKMPHLWFNASFREPWMGASTLAALLLALLMGYSRHWSGWNRFYWAPVAIVALGLVVFVDFH